MATAKKDIQDKIAATLGDESLREALMEQRLRESIALETKELVQKYENNVVAFREAYGQTIDDDEDQWRKLTGNSKRDLPSLTHQRMISLAVYLWESNLLANRLIELPIAYLLAEGVKVVADDESVQDIIDRFWNDPINAMDLKLPKKARELAIFGNQFWPAFVNEFNGHVRLGYLDPALVETVVMDPDNPEQPIGIITVKDKRGHARRYRVIVNGSEEDLFTARTREIRETFDTGECFFFCVNDLSNGRLGRSDLLAQIDWLDAYDQFMFGELDRAQFLRAFIWDITIKGGTPDEIKKRAREISTPNPGSSRIHNDSEIWDTVTPDLQASDSSETARLFRNHILGGASQPEHWYGGGGDVNRATAGEMGEPTFKMMTMRQKYLGYILKTVLQFAIRKSEMATMKREPDLHEEVYNFEVQFPEMVSKDVSKFATALGQVTAAVATAINNELMSRERGLQIIEKISSQLGVEFDAADELAAAIKEAKKKSEEDNFNDLPGDAEDEGAGE